MDQTPLDEQQPAVITMNNLPRCFPIVILILASATPNPCPAQDLSQLPELRFWTVGNDGSTERFGSGFWEAFRKERDNRNRVLLAIAERPLSETEIRESSGLSGSRTHDVIASLEAMHLIQRHDGDRWATTVPVITDRWSQRIKSDLVPMARAVAGQIEEQLPRLRTLYDESRSPVDPPWEEVAHLLVDKFIIDGSFHSAIGDLERERGVQGRYSEEQRVITAFFIELGENFSTLGCNWYAFTQGDEQREVYVLHGAAFQRYDIRMNEYRDDPDFPAALFAIAPDGAIDALTDRDRAVLDALEWTSGDRLLVPAVRASTIESLRPALETIGRAGAEAAFDNYSVIIDSFDGSPYSGFLEAAGDYIQVSYHTLFSSVLERLVEDRALPRFPEPVPEHFGVYIVMGKLF
jgi:hypothetical protein